LHDERDSKQAVNSVRPGVLIAPDPVDFTVCKFYLNISSRIS